LEVDNSKNCVKVCQAARKSTVRKEDAYKQAKKWNECKQCVCWENPDMEMCEAIDCHINCWANNFSGERCLQCTRCNSCPGVGREKDTMTHAIESIFSRGEGGTSEEANMEGGGIVMGERRSKRTVNSQFGYQHQVGKETTKWMKKLKVFNVFDPKCRKCVKMGQQQSCRESCAAYKRNPQNHVAASNCKASKPPCAPRLASGCKKCIRECFNVKTVALSALPSGGQDGSKKAIELGDTTFENCYNTFGCANDCDASLTKIKGALEAKTGRPDDALELFVGEMTPEERVDWAQNLPFDSVKDAREKGFLVKGIFHVDSKLDNKDDSSLTARRDWSPLEYKKSGWWW